MYNVAFLAFYVLASGFLSGADILIILSIHFGINVVRHVREKQLIITPILLFYLGVIIVNVANLDLIHQVETHSVKTYRYIIPQFIDRASLIWCVSSVLCAIGYDLAIYKTLPPVSFDINKKSILKNIFWILFIYDILSIIGLGTFMKGNQIGKIFELINSIGILFFARLWAVDDNKTYRAYAIALFILETYIAMTTAFLRFALIVPTFYLAAGYFIGKKKMSYLFSYRIIPFIIIILVYSSVFSSLQQNRSNFIGVFTGDVEKPDVDEDQTQNSGGLLDRSANLAQITNVVNLVDKNDFYGGAASAPIITALIPRALWPDKPLIQLGAWFALEIGVGSKTSAGTANNSVNMTVAGELYLDFGWVGVALGSLLFGAFLAVLWNSCRFYSSEYNLTGTIFGGYLLLLSIGSYADLQIVITLLSTYLIFLIIKKIAHAV